LRTIRSKVNGEEGEISDPYGEQKAFETASLLAIIQLFLTAKISGEELLPLLKK
jgi:hypothetical protein